MKPNFRIRTNGAYVIKSAESRPVPLSVIEARARELGPRPTPLVPTDADRALARAVRAAHRRRSA